MIIMHVFKNHTNYYHIITRNQNIRFSLITEVLNLRTIVIILMVKILLLRLIYHLMYKRDSFKYCDMIPKY